MRCIGLDIHRDVCEMAIAEHVRVRSAGRIGADPTALAAFGATLRPDDVVTLEAIGNALAMARILEPVGSTSPWQLRCSIRPTRSDSRLPPRSRRGRCTCPELAGMGATRPGRRSPCGSGRRLVRPRWTTRIPVK